MHHNQPSTSSFNCNSHTSLSISAPSLFCEPEPRDFGQRFFGQRGFGGLLQDWSHPNNDRTTRWIPQYNLQNYWRRQIPPYCSNLVEPLISPRIKNSNDFDRLPGHFPFRINEFELYNRNLLATRFFDRISDEVSGTLKIWTVNERSKRRTLECFSVEIDSDCIPIIDTIQHLPNFKLKMLPPMKNESRPPKSKEPLLELRTSMWNGESFTRMFLRSPTLLRMVHFPEDHLTSEDEEPVLLREHIPIFNTAVKSFSESHLIEGSLAVVDYGGRVWIHDICSNSPEKAEKLHGNDHEIYQYATFTDHPKIVAVAGNYHLETVDMRCSRVSRACKELWRSRLFETRGNHDALYVQGIPPPTPMIRHINRVSDTANNYLVMTDQALHLIDDRFPGKSVLTVYHPFSTGTHKMVMSEKVMDSVDCGHVYSVFCLDQLQVLDSSVSMTKIYNHPSGIWSSVSGFHSIGEPNSFDNTVRRGKYAEPAIPVEPTRAISLVEHKSMTSSLLLRQTDDGAIWWQKFCKEIKNEDERDIDQKQSIERFIVRRSEDGHFLTKEDHDAVYCNEMSETVKEDPKEKRQVLHVDAPSIDRRTISKFYHRAVNLQSKSNQFHVSPPSQILDVLPLDDVNSVLSKITLDTWKAAETMMAENSSS